MSSPQTFMWTSIDELNARLTFASICTTFPSLIGFSNEILSTDAVTTGALQCRPAANAAAISIQYINLPPIRSPWTFVSFGSTNSVIIVCDSFAVFGLRFIPKVCTNIALQYSLLRFYYLAQCL